MPGRMPDAAAEYEAALRIDPDLAEAHYDLGLALSGMGRPAEALSHFEAALKIRPDYAEAHNNLAVTLVGTPRRAAEAMAHFEEAVRIQPDYLDAHFNLGVALAEELREERAKPSRTWRPRSVCAPTRNWTEPSSASRPHVEQPVSSAPILGRLPLCRAAW